jgi:acetyltransferase EpsM
MMKQKSSKKIIIIGGLGNGSVIAAAIQEANNRGFHEWSFHGYLNDRIKPGEMIDGMPVVGGLSDTKKFLREGYYFINTIFRIDGQQERIDMFEDLGIPDDKLAVFVHPAAYVAPNVNLGPGSVVMPNASLSPGTTFGKGNLIMVNAIIGHDNKIGDYCHFAAQCCVGAYLKIGDGVHIGLNASIKENLTIGKNATLGMGAVLTKDIGENEIWVGNPAKFLRKAQ